MSTISIANSWAIVQDFFIGLCGVCGCVHVCVDICMCMNE